MSISARQPLPLRAEANISVKKKLPLKFFAPITILNRVIIPKPQFIQTVRQAAKHYGISKSTVHKDVTERLHQISPTLSTEVRMVLDVNKSERHIRGGLATKEKYLHQKPL